MDQSRLHPDSYTAQRLQHGTPEHLYLTSRRCFIGPIPEGWLKSHRRDWYRHHLHINYSSRAATFSASPNVTRDRRLTGLDVPDASSAHHTPFPQPKDLSANHDGAADREGADSAPAAASDAPAAAVVPRAAHTDTHIVDEDLGSRRKKDTSLNAVKSPKAFRDRPAYRRDNTGSFVTACEVPPSLSSPEVRVSMAESSLQASSSPRADASTSSLIPRPEPAASNELADEHPEPLHTRIPTGRSLKFDVPEDSTRAEIQAKARLAQASIRRKSARLRRSKTSDGQIVKMEKMLVRVDATLADVDDDFDENAGHRIESRTAEKWREYMVVCRDSVDDDPDVPFTLQMYKTRVIPAVEGAKIKKRAKHEIQLNLKITKVNLYSSLDKTVVIWTPWRKGTRIFIMRPRSGSSAAEWYTFLRKILGWQRASELQINIPDLDVSLRLDNPFQELETSKDLEEAAKGNEEAMAKAVEREHAIAQNIIKRSLDMLSSTKDYKEIVKQWTESQRIGLAWKRYDRLEWIHGTNEQKMYGSIAMARTHELELRPKDHYPTTAKTKKNNILPEPVPVEGFLIRLTSQRGVNQKLGRMFFKRLYFSTHDNFLVFSRPARVVPPPPPKLPNSMDSKIPSAKQISEGIPIIYAVNPYPVKDGQIEWLSDSHLNTPENILHHDRDAADEAKRRTDLLLKCDGYINLCNIKKVRKVHRGATPVDQNLDEGSDVDFDLDVDDTNEDDGVTKEFDDERTFELLLRNGLIIRLQAYDKMTKKEWMRRLRELVKYWKYRTASDIQLYKNVRNYNLKLLNIDEEGEAVIGQFAKKWEVSHTHASSELYNLCGISACRTVHISGILYRKPRRHGTFTRCSVMLSSGMLLIFQDSLRRSTGKQLSHIHHEHITSLDLRDCYLYSGLLTENDLLYQNRTFDNNKPGHTALPRIYLEDGWTSTDEDTMTCFVIWHGKKKSLFRRGGDAESSKSDGEGEGGLRNRFKLVSQLGVPGNTMVFKARSRAERDHWVLAIQTEIERLAQGVDVRIVGKT